MSFSRIIGKNNKIYSKVGDYCISEENSECFIICSYCQECHENEDTFWSHISEKHNFSPPAQLNLTEHVAKLMVSKQIPIPLQNGIQTAQKSPEYIEAEYLENIDDPESMLDFGDQNIAINVTEAKPKVFEPKLVVEDPQELADKIDYEAYEDAKAENSTENRSFGKQFPYIDVNKISSRKLLHGKVLKLIFQQMHRADNELNYRVNKLYQQYNTLQNELKRSPFQLQKNIMKVLPDQPLRTRDEVLAFDRDLSESKDMRETLHEEALLVIADNADFYVRVLWRFIMTDEVANQFCWRGVVDGGEVIKFPVKDMNLVDVLQAAFREKFPAQPINYFKERTICYFNKAQERMRRTRVERERLGNLEEFKTKRNGNLSNRNLLLKRRRSSGDSIEAYSVE